MLFVCESPGKMARHDFGVGPDVATGLGRSGPVFWFWGSLLGTQVSCCGCTKNIERPDSNGLCSDYRTGSALHSNASPLPSNIATRCRASDTIQYNSMKFSSFRTPLPLSSSQRGLSPAASRTAFAFAFVIVFTLPFFSLYT